MAMATTRGIREIILSKDIQEFLKSDSNDNLNLEEVINYNNKVY